MQCSHINAQLVLYTYVKLLLEYFNEIIKFVTFKYHLVENPL